MTIKEAETITQMYGSFFANVNEHKYPSEDGVFVFSSFDLPWSPAKLKYAFFTLAEDMVKNNEIDEHFDLLKFMYGTIDGSFKEEAQKINERMEQMIKIKDTDKSKTEELKFEAEFGISSHNPDNGLAGEVEFQNFIADLYGNFANK